MLAIGASVVAAALLVSPVPAGAAATGNGGLPGWPSGPDWQQYVEAPASLNLTPVRVVRVSGSVTNPGGIVAGGHGDTTLSRSAADTGPTDVVLDYGHDVGGIPSFTAAAASGSPTMEAGYSEAAEYIAPGGDGGTPTIGANGDPSRSDSYTVSGPGVITNRYIQGGERYQEISLTSPGSVSPGQPGIRDLAGRPAAGSLSWAEGAVPTPHGDITVKWASSPGGFAIAIRAPWGTTGTVVLPKGAARYSVMVNGSPVAVAPGQAAVSMR